MFHLCKNQLPGLSVNGTLVKDGLKTDFLQNEANSFLSLILFNIYKSSINIIRSTRKIQFLFPINDQVKQYSCVIYKRNLFLQTIVCSRKI